MVVAASQQDIFVSTGPVDIKDGDWTVRVWHQRNIVRIYGHSARFFGPACFEHGVCNQPERRHDANFGRCHIQQLTSCEHFCDKRMGG